MQVNSAIEAPDTSRARGTWTTAVYWLLSLGLGGLILATGVGKALDVPGFIGVLHTIAWAWAKCCFGLLAWP